MIKLPKPPLPKESNLERRISQYADRIGLKQVKLNVIGRRNWPDRAFFPHGGKPLLMELKRKGAARRPGQIRLADELTALDYNVVVCDNFNDAKKEILKCLPRNLRLGSHISIKRKV